MDKIEMILNRQGCPFTRDELEAMPEPVLDKLTTLNSEVAPEPTPAPADRTDEVLSAIGAMSARIDQLEKQQKAVETAEVASVTNALVKAGVEVEKLEGMTLPQLHLLQNALSPSYSGVPAPGQRHYEPLDEFEELAMPSLNGVEA